VRAFFAIDLPKAAVDGAVAAIAALKGFLPSGATFTAHDRIHVTLQFLGEIDEARAERAIEVARGLVFEPFEIVVGAPGAFPDRAAPRVIFLEIERDAPLRALAEGVGRRLHDEGFTLDERPYRPHVTLARIHWRRSVAAAREALSKLTSEPVRAAIDRFFLYESVGGVYRRRAELPLTRG
jgi:2'-5' RNA ligase